VPDGREDMTTGRGNKCRRWNAVYNFKVSAPSAIVNELFCCEWFPLDQLLEQPAMLSRAELLAFIATSLAQQSLEWSYGPFSIVVIGADCGSHYNV
jgi:hypothetical protein